MRGRWWPRRRWSAVRYYVHCAPVVIARRWTSWAAFRVIERDCASGQYQPRYLYEWHVSRTGDLPELRLADLVDRHLAHARLARALDARLTRRGVIPR